MSRMPAQVLGGILVTGTSCSTELYRPPIIWEGQFLRFGTDEDPADICGGTLPQMDTVAGHLGEVFGAPDPSISFYWMPDGLPENCPDAGGCAFGAEVFSQVVPHQHEIVHAVRPRRASPPLEEGLAELFGDDWERDDPASGSAAALFEMYDGGTQLPAAWYQLAGYFASYLRAAHGEERLIELVDASRREDSWERTQAVFEDVYGFPIDDALAELEDYPACDQTWYRDNEFECSQPAVALASEPEARTDLTVAMGCDEDTVIGPRFGERWTTIAIELDQDGVYIVDFDKVGGHADGRLRARECGQSCFVREVPNAFVLDMQVESQPEPPGPSSVPDGAVCIPAGRHLLRLAIDADDDGEFVLRFFREGGSVSCAEWMPCFDC